MTDERKKERRKKAEDKLREDELAYELRMKNMTGLIDNAGKEVSQRAQELIDVIKEEAYGNVEEKKELFLKAIEKLEQTTNEQTKMREERIDNIEWTVLLGIDNWLELNQSMELSTEFFDNPEMHNVTLLYELEETSGKEIVDLLEEQINSPDKFYIGTVNGRRELIFRAPVFDHDEYYVSSQATEDYIGGKKSLKEIAAGIYDSPDLVSLTVDEEHINMTGTPENDVNIETESIFYDVCTTENVLSENERKSIDDSFQMEQRKWKETLDRFVRGELRDNKPIDVGETPNSAILANANPLKIVITYSALRNSMADNNTPSRRHSQGHALKKEELDNLLEYLRTPLLIFREDKIGTTSLTIVTDGKNSDGKEIVIALALDKNSNRVVVNRISTIFPANNIREYIDDKIENHTLIAVNKKANELMSDGRNFPRGQFISFDKNVPYIKNVVNLNKLKELNEEELSEMGINRNVLKRETSDTPAEERIPVAIESTVDFADPETGFVSTATENMPKGTKYRLVTFGEKGHLVPYQETSNIFMSRTEARNYIKENRNMLEFVNYDEMVYQAGRKISEYTMRQHEIIDEGMHSFEFEDGYLYFSIDINGYSYDGLYRIYDPANGKSREIVSINDGHREQMIEENWEYIEHKLAVYVNEHPLIGENGEEIPREKASIYCEWSEHDAFEEGKVYSISEFNQIMEYADGKWRELREKEREQYGGADKAFEVLSEQKMPQHQSYAKVKFTVYVPGMETLTLRQDVGDGFGGVIDYIRKTKHKHYVEPLEAAMIQEKTLAVKEKSFAEQVDEAAVTIEAAYESFADAHNEFIKNAEVSRIPVVINAFGGPGAGKSVSCMDVCQQLKKLGYNAEYVQEYAKELVYDKNWDMLDGTPEHQFEVLKEQLNRIDRLYGSVDFIVTDSPVLLNGVYNKSLTPEYDSMVTSLYKDFENFSYFVERDASSYQQEGRIQNLEESQKIDQDIKQLLREKDVYFGTYNHDTIDKVVSNSITTFNRINHIEETASKKQIAYAEKIAKSLDIDLPDEKSKAAYKAFISKHQEEFSNNNAPLREQDTSGNGYQDYLDMVAKNGSTLKAVPKEYYTDELLLAAVRNWGAAIRLIPEEKITKDIVIASVRQYGQNLKHIPEAFKSKDVCVEAYISSSGKSLRYTPNDIRNQVKEEGQESLAGGNDAISSFNRIQEIEKLQEKGKEWATQIENMLKEHEQNPEAMVEDIAFAAKFHQYSSKNIQLMVRQNPGITYVASAAAFEKMGYHIKENEPAMIARVPIFTKYVVTENAEKIYSWNYTPEIKKKIESGILKEKQTVRKFQFVAAFFDISQTDCPAEDYPSIFHMGVPSELHQEAFDAMKEFAEKSLGFKVMITDLKSISLRGNCNPDERIIRINDKLESTMALSTLCHEIAHGIIHTSEAASKMTTAQKECEADVMDIMLETSMGLPITESRREHLFYHFHAYKDEQAAKEPPYEVTLENLIDRVQKKVFRPYAEEIHSYLSFHLPAEGSRNDELAKEVIQNIALLDSAYGTNHDTVIELDNELFDSSRAEDYRELYRRTKEEYRLNNSFVPKLAVMKSMDGGEFYNLCDVQLLDETTADLIRSFPETITPDFLQNVEKGNILALKENVLEKSGLYLVTGEGLQNVTEILEGKFDTIENKINCGFNAVSEYQCLHSLLKNGIELEAEFKQTYNHICETFGFSKDLKTDSGMRLMARINLVTEGLSRNNRELIAEYVFRTGNYQKAEQYAEQIQTKPDCIRKLMQEMKLVDSYKYMLWTIAEYENNNDVSVQERITTGAYNESAIPVLSENVKSLSQINKAFLLIRKYESLESVKLYSLVEDNEAFRIAYVELNEYQPEIVYSTVSFDDYEAAKQYYREYLETPNTRLVENGAHENLIELENKENQIALSDITTIGETVASRKHQYEETGMDEEAAFELIRSEIRENDISANIQNPNSELQIFKEFKKLVNYYGEERFIELSNLAFSHTQTSDTMNAVNMDEALRLADELKNQKEIIINAGVKGTEDVIRCMDAALESRVTAVQVEKAINAVDYILLSNEFENLGKEFEDFGEYNDVLETLKAAQVTPDKFCYIDFDAVPGPYLYTNDQAGNIYRKSLRNEWEGSVRDLNNRLKESGYEICTNMDDFRAYSANNRLGCINTQEKEKSEAYIQVLESRNDILKNNSILSIYDFKNTLDKIYSGTVECRDDITYKLVTRKNQEIHSYIDTFSGNAEQNVYEQLYGKAKEQVPELSRSISKQYYQDMVNFNERHLMKPLLEQLKKEGKPAGESEELSNLLESNDKLKEVVKELDLSPADAELLKLNSGNIQTEQIANIEKQMQMNRQMQQRKMKNLQTDGISLQ